MGSGSFRSSAGTGRPGRNSAVSTPRIQARVLPIPRLSSSRRKVGVATMTPCEGRWNQRMAFHPQLSGSRQRACMYSGKRVCSDVVKGRLLRRHQRRAASPSGPSVAMWMQIGSRRSRRLPTVHQELAANRISG